SPVSSLACRRSGGPRSRRRTSPVPVLLVAVVAILLLPGALAVSLPNLYRTQFAFAQPHLTYAATASLGSNVGSHAANPFFAVEFNAAGLGPNSAAALGRYFNSTPFTWFRLGEGGHGYDPTTQVNWIAPASGSGKYVADDTVMVNFTWFKSWCYSRTPHCQWIGTLPAEQNDSAAAVHYADYFHNVLHFAPSAWQMGNEPSAWVHYGINVTQWSTSDSSKTNGIGYATMVGDYITAVSNLYPSDRFIGIEANCACNPDMVTTTASVDGPQLWAMAYHSYPWANDSSNKTSQFMGALQSPTRNLSYTADRMRTLVTNGCATCTNMAIQVGEYNAGPVPVHSPLALTYSGAPFIAASVIEALQANVSMFTLFSLGWLYNTSNAHLLPEGILYQQILNNLTMGTDYLVNVKSPGVGGVYAMLIQQGTHESLLIVNTNNTKAITLPISTSLFPVGLKGSTWSWDPRTTLPYVQTGITLPTTYTLWSQGILLINNY
ncbi:MAG TPA: hypothetical protein VIZ68_05775, partial [Thermoplasmata archaeon]